MNDEHIAANRRNWNERAAIHAASTTYALDACRTDPSRLREIVRFDRPRLGDVADLDVVHLALGAKRPTERVAIALEDHS